LRFDPTREMEYRAQLAREYLQDAEDRFHSNDFKGCVQYSQLASENAAKAVIAKRRTPSWGHDPSSELLEIAKELESEQDANVTRLAEISSQLAPEHGRTTYGEPERFLTPRMLYDLQAADRAIGLAREAVAIMNHMIARPGQPSAST
jgi:HEPN domain-containing protein